MNIAQANRELALGGWLSDHSVMDREISEEIESLLGSEQADE